MKITDYWIKKNNPCQEAIDWWDKKERNPLKILSFLIEQRKCSWANWFIVRVMTYKQRVSYAVYAAEQVIGNYEKKYPNDKRPREAIKAAKRCINAPNKKNRSAAKSAARSTRSAESAAWSAARSAAESAAWSARSATRSAAKSAAWSARFAAESAAWSAWSAWSAAWYAAESAAESAAKSAAESATWFAWSAAESVAESAMQLKILKYGMKLLRDNQ